MIRRAVMSDIDAIMDIYDIAKAFMRKNGNMTQWCGGYPYRALVAEDIENGNMHVVVTDENSICACFGLFVGNDPVYDYIDGKWGDDSPYCAIHRVASDGREKGIFRRIFDYAAKRYDHLRIDTHEDNIPMQKVVTNCGFQYRGIIYLEDKSPRLAYEWSRLTVF